MAQLDRIDTIAPEPIGGEGALPRTALLGSAALGTAAMVVVAAVLGIAVQTMELTYTRLHLFLILPLLALALVPPRPLQFAPREIRQVGYRMPLLLAAIAFTFSCVWDNLLAWKGVWIV